MREGKRAGRRVCVSTGLGRGWPPAACPPQKGLWHWHSPAAPLRRGRIERKWPSVPPFCGGPCEITVALLFLPSFLEQVKEINGEKSLSLTSSFGEQEKKKAFSLKEVRRKCWGSKLDYLLLSWEMQSGSRTGLWGLWVTGQQQLWVRLCESICVCFLRRLIKPCGSVPKNQEYQEVQGCSTPLPNGICLIPSETQSWEEKEDPGDCGKGKAGSGNWKGIRNG